MQKKNLYFNYELKDITTYKAIKEYDAAGLIYVHIPPDTRTAFHKKIIQSIKQGGHLVIEAFSKEQMQYSSGGPNNSGLLYSKDLLLEDLRELTIVYCRQEEVVLNEGAFHKGKASVIQITAQKI